MDNVSKQTNTVDPSVDLEVFFEMLDVPVYCNLLWRSRAAAQNCPKGDIRLAFDRGSGVITNLAFDPAKLGYNHSSQVKIASNLSSAKNWVPPLTII